MCKIEVCFLLPSRVVRVLYMIYEKCLPQMKCLVKLSILIAFIIRFKNLAHEVS